MNWYKISQESIQIPITHYEMQDALERSYFKNKEYLQEDGVDRKTFESKEYQEQLEQILHSDSELYYRLFQYLPQEITIEMVLNAYFNGTLPKTKPVEKPQKIPFTNTPQSTSTLPYQKPPDLSDEEIKKAWITANQRATQTNLDEVKNARNQIFSQWMTNKFLSQILNIDIKEINKKMKYWSGTPQKAIELHERLNRDVPEQVQWHGIVNSSFLGQQTISKEEMGNYVGDIEVPEENQSTWEGREGQILRNYIVRTLKAVDTNIEYKNLSFSMRSTMKPGGKYLPPLKKILVKNNYPDTIAHEMGHYLDHKWAEEAYQDTSIHFASTLFNNLNPESITNPLRRKWTKKFYDFVMKLSLSSDIRSEYTQDRTEVFARFVAKFVDWTQNQAGIKYHMDSNKYEDKFNTTHFTEFVTILQEKAYVDLIDPPKSLPPDKTLKNTWLDKGEDAYPKE